MTDDMAKTIEAAQKQLEKKLEDDREREAKEKRYQELVAENKREEAERREKERREREKDKEFQRQEKEAEARRKKAERADEALRRRVEQDEEREKAKEFREMAKRNAARKPEPERRQITPETIKASIKKAASKTVAKAPAVIDRGITGAFGGIATGLMTPMAPGTARSMYRGETKELSRAVRPTKKPITGGKVKPVPIVHSRNAIVVNPNYIDSLIGNAPTKKTKGTKDPMGNFLKRLF